MAGTGNREPRMISGISVGHVQDLEAATGCTVVLCPEGAVCGVDQRGGAPCTRETDLLRPMHLVEKVHGVLLTGGSSFGLAAADGVVRWLEEHEAGFDVGVARVPIVPAAALFDLALGRADVRPDAAMGYDACRAASSDLKAGGGNVGAGAGATVGHVLGPEGIMKGGLGVAVLEILPGIRVGAVFAVNCFGDVIHPKTGKTLAGARNTPEGTFVDPLEALTRRPAGFAEAVRNTVIGVVLTNAALSKEAALKVAQMAHNGLARTIVPAHTLYDGDTIFALATGTAETVDVNIIGGYAVEATALAVIEAVTSAVSLHGVPACRDRVG